MNDRTIQALKLFVEKADELLSSDFYKFIRQQGLLSVKAGINTDTGIFGIEAIQPNRHALNDFLYPIRIFTLEGRRDICSLASLKRISEDDTSGVSSEWRQRFKAAYSLYTQCLAEYSVVPSFTGYTRREIMEVFLYGDKFHVQIEKKQLFDEWKTRDFFFPLLEADFKVTLYKICAVVLMVAQFTKKELRIT